MSDSPPIAAVSAESAQSPHAPSAAPALSSAGPIDLELPFRMSIRSFGLLAGFLALTFGLIFGAEFIARGLGFATSGATPSVIGGFGGGLLILLFIYLLPSWSGAALARACRSGTERDRPSETGSALGPAVDRVLAACRDIAYRYGQVALTFGWRNHFAAVAAVELAQQGATGQAVRFCRNPSLLPPAPAPLEHSFEPTPLADVRESFIELRGQKVSPKDRLRSMWRAIMEQTSRGWLRYLVVGMIVLGWLAMLGMAVVAVFSLLLGRYWSNLTPMLLWAPVLILAFAYRHIRSDTWHIVPSGVIVLKGHWWSRNWRAELFHRGDSALVYWKDGNIAALGRRDRANQKKFITPFEAEMLLRAWYCPFPAPDAPRVQAFAQGRDES